MTTYFENKDQYLSFRAAWAEAVNSEKAKSYLVPHDEYIPISSQSLTKEELKEAGYKTTWDSFISKGTGQSRVSGWIRPTHVILYNILRGKHPATGFTPLTNKNKIIGSGYMNYAYVDAARSLNFYIEKANAAKRSPTAFKAVLDRLSKFVTDKDAAVENHFANAEKIIDNFLKPFNGTVTHRMLREIPKVDYELYSYNYGVGMKMFNSGEKFTNIPTMIEYANALKEAA